MPDSLYTVLYIGIDWKIGDIVWSKFSNWPFWPAVVIHDRYGYYKHGDNIHVLFVETPPTSAWVNSKYVLLMYCFCSACAQCHGVVWRCGNSVRCVTEVTLHQAWLVLGW